MKQKFLFLGILATGILISGAVLFFWKSNIFAQSVPTQWTEKVGEGIMAPACNSSFGPTASSCAADGTATVTFNWVEYPYGTYGSCQADSVRLYYQDAAGSPQLLVGNLPCTGSYTVTGLLSNTTYSYYFLYIAYMEDAGSGYPGWADHYLLDPYGWHTITTPICTTTCSGGVDIGLKAVDSSGTFKVAAQPGAESEITSPLKIYQNYSGNGQGPRKYGIVLVDPGTPDASNYFIQTAAGKKAFCKLP